MTKTYLTFEDLQKYIKTVNRDQVGMHYPMAKGAQQNYPVYTLHIYDGMRQVNLCMSQGPDAMPISIANFIFDEDEVSMIQVRLGVADYDNPLRVPITTPIDTPLGAMEQSHEVSTWIWHLGPKGNIVQKVLRDILWPVVLRH